MKSKTQLLAARRGSLLLALLLASAGAFADGAATRVFIFGDSVSDGGNIYALTGETAKAPYALIPSRPYAIGGHHFSNGKTWAERFAQSLNDNAGGKASLDNPGKNGNYAFGGARARTGSNSSSPDSVQQIQMFFADYGSAPGGIYVLQFGGNDLRDALEAAASSVPDALAIIEAAVQQSAANIQTLYIAGARRFLVVNAPNLAHAPAVKLAGASGIAGFFTGLYNGALEGALQQLEMALPGVDIERLDLASFTDAVVADPGAFGLTNVATPCLSFLTSSGAICSSPETHLFWDGLHPTAAAHVELAKFAVEVAASN